LIRTLDGGVPFSVEDLQQVWGEETARSFEHERAVLEAQVRSERPQLSSDLEEFAPVERASIDLPFTMR